MQQGEYLILNTYYYQYKNQENHLEPPNSPSEVETRTKQTRQSFQAGNI